MFLAEQAPLPLTASTARRRLVEFVQREGIQDVSAQAFGEGRHLLMRAGVRGVSKEVQVQVLPAYMHDDTLVLPLRWVATGPTGALFPQLDANLEIAPTGPTTSQLIVEGAYRPPLGALGSTLDRVALHKVAKATVRKLLATLTSALSGDAVTTEPQRVEDVPVTWPADTDGTTIDVDQN